MINERYRIAMSETLQYLKGIDHEDLNKIPSKFIDFLNENCSKDYVCKFDYTKPLKEIKISNEARGLIAMICLNYWCETDEQKEMFKNHLSQNELKHQETLRKKYNPDNLFKNHQIDCNVKTQSDMNENTKMIKYEKKWYQKIIDKILNIFRKK